MSLDWIFPWRIQTLRHTTLSELYQIIKEKSQCYSIFPNLFLLTVNCHNTATTDSQCTPIYHFYSSKHQKNLLHSNYYMKNYHILAKLPHSVHFTSMRKSLGTLNIITRVAATGLSKSFREINDSGSNVIEENWTQPPHKWNCCPLVKLHSLQAVS